MKNTLADYFEGEEEALRILSQIEDPTSRVIYSMSMRQLAMAACLVNMEAMIIRLVEALDGPEKVPSFRKAVLGVASNGGA
jgi:hypothetical protein